MATALSQAALEAKLQETRRLIADKWGWFLTVGILLMLVGFAAIVFPLIAGITAKILLGWLFLVGGVIMVLHAFQEPGWSGFLWELLIGLLYVVAGGYLAFFPLTGLLTLTILLAALFFAEGIMEILMAFRVRPHDGWGFLLLSGIAALAVGVLIAIDLPGSAAWALGLLFGINLLFTGSSYVALALAGRKVATA